jgi:deferrochelatase/peroxidase EfeB
MNTPAPEYQDMQALLRFGFKHLHRASFVLLQVKDAELARAWLATAPVTSAATASPLPATALQIALSSDGLRALGIAPSVVDAFSSEFLVGMSGDPGRSRRLGDVAQNDPARWEWGAESRVPHVLLMLYANADTLPSFRQSILDRCAAGFALIATLDTDTLDEFEPFGFKDGLSQPKLDWQRERPVRDEEQLEYSNLVCLGEFVLGYPNEYGGYTDRPLLDPSGDMESDLPRAEDAPELLDLGRNGSYLVMRQLEQDVAGFWRYLDRQAGGDAVLRERLAAAMVGRTLSGEPLVGDDGKSNVFTYDADPRGLRCPLGAHIRRSNPRNADLPPGTSGLWLWLKRTLGFDAAALDRDHVSSTRFHRLLRRGRKYGPMQSIAQALVSSATDASGLYFICLNANIARQFEFLQSAWIVGTRFDALASEGDPLLGHRQSGPDGIRTDVYSIPRTDGPDERLTDIPSFVTVRGGGYFFLPGLRCLRYLATAR